MTYRPTLPRIVRESALGKNVEARCQHCDSNASLARTGGWVLLFQMIEQAKARRVPEATVRPQSKSA